MRDPKEKLRDIIAAIEAIDLDPVDRGELDRKSSQPGG